MQNSDLETIILTWVREHSLLDASEGVDVTLDTDLFESGVLDSVAFIELVLFLEEQVGQPVDLSDADPSEFATVRGLCGIAAGSRS